MGKKKAVNQMDTIIGAGSIIEGHLLSKASVRIEGTFEGDIECEGDVIISATGTANSNIKARNVYNAGQIRGSIVTDGLLDIDTTGIVNGHIDTAALTIHRGGTFEGESTMKQKPAEPAPADNVKPIKPHDGNEKPLLKKEKEAIGK